MDTPRGRVREELKGLAMYARSKPGPELVEEDIGIRLDRIIAALTAPADGWQRIGGVCPTCGEPWKNNYPQGGYTA